MGLLLCCVTYLLMRLLRSSVNCAKVIMHSFHLALTEFEHDLLSLKPRPCQPCQLVDHTPRGLV